MLRILLAIIFISLSCSPMKELPQVAEPILYPFFDYRRMGFINQEGRVVTHPQFQQSYVEFRDGLTRVWSREHKNNELKSGYLNTKGELVIPLEFHSNSHWFSEGLAAVYKDNKWGYIGRSGAILIEPQFYAAYDFHEGLALVEIEKGLAAIINKKGDIVFEYANYEDNPACRITIAGLEYREGLIPIAYQMPKKLPKIGYVDDDGNVVVDFLYPQAGLFSEGLARVFLGQKWGYIHKDGTMAIPFLFSDAEDFKNGVAKVRGGPDHLYGYINKRGKLIIPLEYSIISDYVSGGLVSAKSSKGNKFGYVNLKGKVVIDFKYWRANDFSEGLALVQEGEEWMFINELGEKAFDLEFKPIYLVKSKECHFKGGLAHVILPNKKKCYINKKGEIVFEYDW